MLSTQRLIAALCLVALCFRATVGMGLVHCTGLGEESRFELGCVRDDAGQSTQPCGDTTADDDRDICPISGPCKDQPVGPDLGVSIDAEKYTDNTDVPVPPTVWGAGHRDPIALARGGKAVARLAALPPAMRFIRTVVRLT